MKLYMMVGLPGSGKDTFIKSMNWNAQEYSTDIYIEMAAKRANKSYNEVFKSEFVNAKKRADYFLDKWIADGYSIVWNQTNLFPMSRASKLERIPDYYEKIAVVMNVHSLELYRRNEIRSDFGRSLPKDVLENMERQFTPPTHDEGFKSIWNVWT